MEDSKDISNYIKKAKEQQISDTEIANSLLKAGWSNDDIRNAFLDFSQPSAVPAPQMLEVPKKTKHYSMWIAFEHILLFISLYVMATSLALIFHVFIDKWFPGIPANGFSGYARSFNSTLLRIYLSSIIVSTPLFCYFFIQTSKLIKENPSIRSLRSRKILIYITLVGTFLFLMYGIIKVVYTFLGGNIALNFVLHFLVTSGISGIIFAYYLNEVKEDRK